MKTLFVLLGIVMSSFVLVTEQKTGIISGTVSDKETGAKLPNAKIVISINGAETAVIKTNSSGFYKSAGLTSGTYKVKVTLNGYEPAEMMAKVESLKTHTADFKLSPIVTTTLNDRLTRKEDTDMYSGIAEQKVKSCAADGMGYYQHALPASYESYPVEHNTESYNTIQENNFKSAITDPLSTFSVDVDRASYSNIRRFLSQNSLPNKDAVRIEELINYFDYDYPQPSNEHPFSVTLEKGICPWNEKHEIVLVGLQGENVNEENIPANNLVFLIDVSGSMSGTNKLPLLKQAFKILVDNLRPQDRVSIAVYAGAAGLVLESTPGTEKHKIIAAIDNLQSGGSTAGGAGIKLAYKVAKENFVTNGNNRVIIATDGDFNVGASSDAEMVRLIEEKRNDGIFLTILGFGMGNYKDSKLESLSNAGNGNYAYIDNILEAKKVFGKELWGTLYTIAKDVKIQVEFNPAKVKAYRLVGYENRLLNKEDFNDDKKDAGEIGCGHTVTALYEIIPADSDEIIDNTDPLQYQTSNIVKSNDLMTVKIRYKKPKEDVSILLVQKMDSNSKNKTTSNLNFACSVAQFGMLLRSSEFKGTSSYEKTIAMAKNSLGKDEYGFRNDFVKMIETAQLLSK
jgi:Ca-activated chloride channel homolog